MDGNGPSSKTAQAAADDSSRASGEAASSPTPDGSETFVDVPRDISERSRYQPLVTVVVAVSAGIVFDRFARPIVVAVHDHNAASVQAIAVWWGLAASFLCAWWVLWRSRRDGAAVWFLLVAAALTGAAWHDARWSLFDRGEVGRYAQYDPGPVCIDAVARETPERVPAPQPTPLRAIPGSERSRLLVAVTGIRDGRGWRQASGNCQLTVNGHVLGVRPGDRLRVFGQLGRPSPPLNPGEFDFAAYARADRQLARLRSSAPESVTLLRRGSRWTLSSMLDAARSASSRIVLSMVGPERAGLAAAILLGAREGLQYDQTEPYLVTGTIHVLVVSGMNVAILAAGLLGLMHVGWLSRRTGLAVIIAIVVAYALVAEVQPPVVRAAVLGILICVAAWAGRRGVAFNSLAASALIVLAINPNDLFRAGPQLSFLAVATLVWIGSWTLLYRQESVDRLEQMLAATRPWYMRSLEWLGRWCGWLFISSLAVWLVTLPLVLMKFHVASPVAVLISPLVWLFIFAAMWSGFAMLMVGWLAPPIGALFGGLCGVSLSGLERVVAWAEALPGGHVWAPGPAWWWTLGFYLALMAVMIRGCSIARPRWQIAALSAWILVGLIPPFMRATNRTGLECSFVAVGHGTCVVLETPTGETLLYDAGALGAPEYATQSIASYLWHRGIMRIDGIVISHADIDHYNAVPGLLERFRVGTVYVSSVMFQGFGDAAARGGPQVLQDAIRDAGVPIREIWAGDRLQIGPDTSITVIHPPQNGILGSDNANSITMAVEYRGRRVLLPGDLESPGLDDVIAELPYDCDIVLAPHHGSRHSDPPGFAAWSTPEWVVISGGNDDDVADVAATYKRTGAQVVRTHEDGAVCFSVGPGLMRVARLRPAMPRE